MSPFGRFGGYAQFMHLEGDDKKSVDEEAAKLYEHAKRFMATLHKLGVDYFETEKHNLEIRIWNHTTEERSKAATKFGPYDIA
jgi:hypothetical protein